MKERITAGGVYDDFGLEFEPNAGPADAGAGGDPTPPAAPDPAAGWAGPSQQDWEQAQAFQQEAAGFMGFIYNALQEPDPATGQAPAPADPAAPAELTFEKVQELIDQRAQEQYEQQVGPYRPLLDEIAAERGKALVESELGKLMADEQIGKFENVKNATLMAQGLMASGLPAEQALRQAAILQATDERARGQAGASGERQQIANRMGTTPDPAGTGAAHEIERLPKRDDMGRDRYEQLADRWVEKQRTAGSAIG